MRAPLHWGPLETTKLKKSSKIAKRRKPPKQNQNHIQDHQTGKFSHTNYQNPNQPNTINGDRCIQSNLQ